MASTYDIINTMKRRRSAIDKFKRFRSNTRRTLRLLFPSPAELQFIRIMGGRFITIKFIKRYQTKFPLAIVYKQPRMFKAELVKREVRCGRYFIDFAVSTPYSKKGIEIDGSAYHMDVVAEFDRDSYMYQRGWKLMRIRAPRVWNDSKRVQNEVMKFLIK